MKNTLYYGDNLPIMRQHVPDESIDLVYLDPPFKSDQNYNVLFGEHGVQSAAQIQAFEDTWHWDQAAAEAYQEVVEGSDRVSLAMQGFRTVLGTSDMLAYLSMMAPRLVELRRVLKATGSIYLHCDPTASHYLKILMDAVFGPMNFRNEIAWKRTNARSTQDRWPRIHDILLFYSKTERFCFRGLKTKADQAKLPHTLITGADGKKYQTYELTAPGTTRKGDSGKPWRGYDPTTMGRHWTDSHAKRNEWDKQGLIHWPKAGTAGGFPRRRAKEPFDPGAREITVADVWTDIDRINQAAKERLGYPTQKPEALLERIITASSSEGDTVLDPFCGCGTAIAAAEKLQRRWVGIDITYLAVSLIKKRLLDAFDIKPNGSYDVIGEPITADDADRLAAENPCQFQWWALDLVGAAPAQDERRKGADKGIDGRVFFHDEGPSGKTKQIIVSVKAGTLHVTHVRDLVGVVNREEAAIGVLISMRQATKAMRTEAGSAGFYQSPWGSEGTKHPRIQLFTVAELLAGKQIDMPPCRDLRTHKKAPRAKAKSGHRQPKMF